MNTVAASSSPALPRSLALLLAAGAGLSVASLYYNQPILELIGRDLRADAGAVGLVPTLTQLGYAAGILLFAPLGDRFDRRPVIVAKTAALSLALAMAAAAPSLPWLYAASVLIGLSATAAQDFVPAAAAMAPAASRGSVVGRVMTGLLLGILLSRVVSGTAAAAFGWRPTYVAAASVSALLSVCSARGLPALPASSRAGYGALLGSLVSLLRTHVPLRRAALAQGLLSVAFSGFWSTLGLVLAAPPFGRGSALAGAFGLAGALGALLAPVAGGLADRRGPLAVVRAGTLLVLGSFVVMAAVPWSLLVLALTTVTFDLGVHAALVGHQTVVHGLDASARSRINAVLVSSMFFGMALGSALATRAFAAFGLFGVAALGAGAAALSLITQTVRRAPELETRLA